MKPKSKQTICSSIQSFLDHIKAKWFSNRTIKEYGYSLKLFLSFCQSREVTETRELNRKIVSDYQQYIHGSYRTKMGNPLSMGACEQKLSALKSFCTYLVNEGFLLSDPCQKLEMPKRVQPLPRGILSQDQMKQLLGLPDISTALGYRDRVILELLYGTGIRRKELTGIRLSDFDLKERRLFIAQGKGSKERWVPMPEPVAQVMAIYVNKTRPELVKSKTHSFLIVNYRGGEIEPRAISQIVRKYVKQMGLEGRVTCHSLRHTCATHLLAAKASIRHVQEILGHASLSSTQKYTRVEISDLVRVIRECHPREKM